MRPVGHRIFREHAGAPLGIFAIGVSLGRFERPFSAGNKIGVEANPGSHRGVVRDDRFIDAPAQFTAGELARQFPGGVVGRR